MIHKRSLEKDWITGNRLSWLSFPENSCVTVAFSGCRMLYQLSSSCSLNTFFQEYCRNTSSFFYVIETFLTLFLENLNSHNAQFSTSFFFSIMPIHSLYQLQYKNLQYLFLSSKTFFLALFWAFFPKKIKKQALNISCNHRHKGRPSKVYFRYR